MSEEGNKNQLKKRKTMNDNISANDTYNTKKNQSENNNSDNKNKTS